MNSSTVTSVQLALPAGTRVADLSAAQRKKLFDRGRTNDPQVARTVAGIIDRVKQQGDVALRELALQFDRVELTTIEIDINRCRRALDALAPDLRAALEQSADAIRAYHGARLPLSHEFEVQRGVKIGRRPQPLRSVGVYAPGGQAAYPSSVLMGVLPAKVAGVREVVLCTPPALDGEPSAVVLAACAIAGVDRVFAIGGAGAIAALAFGTESVPRVDKIVGPGNTWVTEAKRQVFGAVDIDSPAGPSEVLIIADESADAEVITSELLAQAEHDADAAVVLVTTQRALIEQVRVAVEHDLARQPRRGVIVEALSRNGALLLSDSEAEMLGFAEAYAPEHLVLLTRQPRRSLEAVRNAGSVFLGPNSSVAFGDYSSGANHVLPTAARARAFSGLSTDDFFRWFTYQEIDGAAAAQLVSRTVTLAEAEGLPAHARAAELRSRSPYPSSEGGPVMRPMYRGIRLYDPGAETYDIDLSDNTNQFGVPPAAERAVARTQGRQLTRYPSPFGQDLKVAIAEWYGVAPENVATGCGCDDMIDSSIRAFCEQGDRIVFPTPTFVMVAHFARVNGVEPVGISLSADMKFDPSDLIAAAGRITYVCNPNNPTGTAFSADVLKKLADEAPGVFLLDEAYAEFADEDYAQTAAASNRMISLRTFSKAFGLAGLRVGFAIGPQVLVHEIEKSRGPYKVTSAAFEAAIAVLRQDRNWVLSKVAEARANREKLSQELERRGYHALPSAANFLLVQVPPGRGATLAASLRTRGIAVRPFSGVPGLGDCIRVTIGPWPMMERFLAELANV